jgi:hypothetical protein
LRGDLGRYNDIVKDYRTASLLSCNKSCAKARCSIAVIQTADADRMGRPIVIAH